jgi:hypothetical protein
MTEYLGAAAGHLGGTPTHAAVSLGAGQNVRFDVAVLAPGMDGAAAAANLEALWRLAGRAMLLREGAADLVDTVALSGSGDMLHATFEVDGPPRERLARLMK